MATIFNDLLTNKENEDPVETDSKSTKRRRSAPITKPPKWKRPKGVSRECFGLLNAGILATEKPDEIIKSMMPGNMNGYKENKARVGLTRTHKFHWVPFINQARSDGLQLFHWEREDKHEPVYRFSRFNKVLELNTYTEDDYQMNYSSTRNWTKEETDRLFDLVQRFDLRWLIIHDRYNNQEYKPRSIEDLKERYYAIANDLQQQANPHARVHSYDAEHERIRKRQLEKQWNRTSEQIEEEEELLKALKIYEKKKKARSEKAAELQAYMNTVQAEEDAFFASLNPVVPPPRVVRKKKETISRKKVESVKFTLESEMKHFKSHQFRTAGVHLRSYEHFELKLKAPRREKNIISLLKACGLPEYHILNTEEITKQLNEFKVNVCLLQDLKDSLTAAEYELALLQKTYPEKNVDITPMFKLTPITSGVVPEEDIGEEGMPTTSRRLAALIVKEKE